MAKQSPEIATPSARYDKTTHHYKEHFDNPRTYITRRRDDGKIRIINKYMDKDGGPRDVDGIAKVVNKDSNARLKVSFFSILGWHIFWGDYWIIGLGNDYEYAIVGHPKRTYG